MATAHWPAAALVCALALLHLAGARLTRDGLPGGQTLAPAGADYLHYTLRRARPARRGAGGRERGSGRRGTSTTTVTSTTASASTTSAPIPSKSEPTNATTTDASPSPVQQQQQGKNRNRKKQAVSALQPAAGFSYPHTAPGYTLRDAPCAHAHPVALRSDDGWTAVLRAVTGAALARARRGAPPVRAGSDGVAGWGAMESGGSGSGSGGSGSGGAAGGVAGAAAGGGAWGGFSGGGDDARAAASAQGSPAGSPGRGRGHGRGGTVSNPAGRDAVFVLFHGGPTCQWSRAFLPVWAAAARQLRGSCLVAMDAAADSMLNYNLMVLGFPTVMRVRIGSVGNVGNSGNTGGGVGEEDGGDTFRGNRTVAALLAWVAGSPGGAAPLGSVGESFADDARWLGLSRARADPARWDGPVIDLRDEAVNRPGQINWPLVGANVVCVLHVVAAVARFVVAARKRGAQRAAAAAAAAAHEHAD